jgi:modulator of FtsH protease HflC
MKNFSTLIIGIVIIALLAVYMITFQVDFNQVAVVTTFGKAERVYTGDEGAGRVLGNLHFKWIWPIQKVYPYDSRIQTLETRLEQLQTADNYSVVVSLFVAWRISDAKAFYTALRSTDEAHKQLEARLRNLQTEISKYTFENLTSADPAQLKLAQAEHDIEASLQAALDKENYGIAIQSIGIKRLELPADVTEKVFDRMRATRQRLAQQARSEGVAEATKIRSDATSDQQRITSFADLRAAEIRAEGAKAAAEVYNTFKADEAFASFQRKLDALRKMLSQNSTIVADPNMVPFDEFTKDHGEPAPAPTPSSTTSK